MDECICWNFGPVDALSFLAQRSNLQSLEVTIESIDSLEAVYETTQLTLNHGVDCEDWPLPQLPCASFSRLTSLKLETAWDKPDESFQYLSQLHNLRHCASRQMLQQISASLH